VGAELTDTAVAPEFRYRETDPSGIVENEICPVFAARITNDVTINEDEVMDYQWVDALFRALDATPWAFSPWMVMEATTARENSKPSRRNKKAPFGAFLHLNALFHRTHRREQDHVADGVAVGEQHHHTVDTNTQTRGGRPCSSAVT
jgi:hypothetical protein